MFSKIQQSYSIKQLYLKIIIILLIIIFIIFVIVRTFQIVVFGPEISEINAAPTQTTKVANKHNNLHGQTMTCRTTKLQYFSKVCKLCSSCFHFFYFLFYFFPSMLKIFNVWQLFVLFKTLRKSLKCKVLYKVWEIRIFLPAD